MAHPINFDGCNKVLLAPAENIAAMEIFTNGVACVSCWQLSPAEIEEVARTGRVFVSVLSGRTQPPIFVGGEAETREVISDYGVWKR